MHREDRGVEGWLRVCAQTLARVSRTRARIAVMVVVAMTAALGAYAATHIGVQADVDEMISADLPHRVLEMEYENKFPVLSETMVVVVDGETPELARDAAAALVERMRSSPAHFESVYAPHDGFFEDHALLYFDTEQLEDFADRLARMQPYLAGLARDGTLGGLADILARGIKAYLDGDVSDAELRPMLRRFRDAVGAHLAGRDYRLSWAEIVAGEGLAEHSRRRIIFAKPVLDFNRILAARDAVDAVQRFVRDLELVPANGVRVRMTGSVILSYEEMVLVQRQVAIAGLVSTLIVAVLLALALRSVRLVSATVVTLLVGLLWTAAFAAAAVGHLNLLSVTFFVLFIGLSVDFAIHLGMRYQELRRSGASHAAALDRTAGDIGPSILLCAVTTAIGFYAFVPTDFRGVAELGLITGTGLFISLLLSLTLLPALMSIGLPPEATGAAPALLSERRLPTFAARYPRTVAVAASVVGLAAAVTVPHVRFEHNPLNLRDPNAESVRTFEELLSDTDASPWTLNVVVEDLERAKETAARLEALPEVSRAVTLSDYVPEQQEAKLGILEDVSLFLALPAADGGEGEARTLQDTIAALKRLRRELQRVAAHGPADALAADAGVLAGALDDLLERARTHDDDVYGLFERLERSLLGTLPQQLDSLERALHARPITLDRLPPELIERMVSRDGDVRIEVYPAENLADDEALARFVAAVRGLEPRVTGSAIGVYEASRAAIRALREALIGAVIVIALLLVVIWRAVGDAILVLIPLGFASVCTAAGAVIFDIPFNFADIVVLPLLLGIGVDSGIHLVHRWRTTRASGARLIASSTAHAVVFSALTTIGSFVSLAFTTHRGVASMGQLLALGIGLMLLANLVLLPALVEIRARRLLAKTGRG